MSSNKRLGCRRIGLLLLIFLVTLLTVGVVFFQFFLGTAVQLIGFRPEGRVDNYWATVQETRAAALPTLIQTATPEPTALSTVPSLTRPPLAALTFTPTPSSTPINPITAVLGDASDVEFFRAVMTPSGFRIASAGIFDVSVQAADLRVDRLLLGESISGVPMAIVEYDEQIVEEICVFLPNMCSDERYKIDSVDLRDEGAIIYGTIPGLSSDVDQFGVIVLLNSDELSITTIAIVMDGTVYSVPESGTIRESIDNLSALFNQMIVNLRLVAPPYQLKTARLIFKEGKIIIIMESV